MNHRDSVENFLDEPSARARRRNYKSKVYYHMEEEYIKSADEMSEDEFENMDCKTYGVRSRYASGCQHFISRKSKRHRNTRAENEYSIESADTSSDILDFSEETVFKFLVKRTGGISSLSKFREENLHLPGDFTEWLLKCNEKLIVYKREEKPKCIGPFYKNATFCFNHSGIGKEKECSRVNCCHFHICKFYLNGFCKNGYRCRKEHDFTNEHNKKIKEKLGLEDFNDEEIIVILLCRYPQVCRARSCMAGEDCPYLHICYNFISNRCEDPECERGHSFETPHNRWVLSVYKMERWPREKLYLLKLLINMPRRQLSVTYLCQTPSTHPTFGYNNSNIILKKNVHIIFILEKDHSESRSILDADAHKQNICLNGLTGSCQERDCNKHHTRLPYLWQIHVFGDWISFHDDGNQKLEQSYSSMEDIATEEVYFEIKLKRITLNFRKEYGVIDMAGNSVNISYRRLTTASYAEENIPLKIGSFYTQWRWYFKNDFGQWMQYETDTLQHTLEKKFLSGQKSYLFTRESHRLKYRVEFTEWKQINIDTKKVRKIRRRPLFVSLAEVQSRRFPKLLDVAIPEPYPAGWDSLDLAHDFEWVDLEKTGREFNSVETEFYTTLRKGKFQISNIYRIQNLSLWNEYKMKRANMEKTQSRKSGRIDERSLFHGTDSFDTCYGICTNNFDFRLSGKNATAYGKGSYFAVSAKYSNNYTKGSVRLMFKAKVLIGDYVKGKHDITCPPIIPGKGHKRYDSCVDDVTNPSIFVVFDRNQCYPEYLIAYKEIPEENSVDWPIFASNKQANTSSFTRVNKLVPATTSGHSRGVQVPSAGIKTTSSIHFGGVSKVPASSQAYGGFSSSALPSSVGRSNPTSDQTSSTTSQKYSSTHSSLMNSSSSKSRFVSNNQANTSNVTKENISMPATISENISNVRGQSAAIQTASSSPSSDVTKHSSLINPSSPVHTNFSKVSSDSDKVYNNHPTSSKQTPL
ncbi:protein mono-ADP-ribosyltransferase PARP12-like [Saccostrea echinata]|uniref:protein mono-ADP-ribosyltransferase PARP12-like n=1 Tax=Saccostrea echinata TaxID=191078 RepID=UPI002A81634A|nr:protein mono-ADP-ribosyltransferase PARP12-like [Saccostrea echinata]